MLEVKRRRIMATEFMMPRSRAWASAELVPPLGTMGTILRCLFEDGAWVSPTIGDALGRCCATCISSPACTSFELIGRRCIAPIDVQQPSNASASRGIVVGVTIHETDDEAQPSSGDAAGRQLRHGRRRRRRGAGGSPPSSGCTERRTFSNESMSGRCDASVHPLRFVLSECGQAGQQRDVAVAQASELYLHGQCDAPCLYHPSTPLAAGWEYRADGRCFERWVSHPGAHEPARCVAALLGAPNELSRILGLVSRTCASGRGCRAAGVASSRAVRASGCEAPHVQRNISSACTSSLATGSPSYVSVDVARSQVNGGVPFALNPMDANELTR